MVPMLARTYGPKYNQFPCFIQPKLNGIRCLYQQGTFQSRGEKLWKPTFFPHIHEQLAPFVGDLILDGELYVHGWRLQRINSAVGVNNNEPNADTSSIQFHIFDVVDPNRNFYDRWTEVYHGLVAQPHALAVPTDFVNNIAELEQHFLRYVALGYEGIMLRPNGPYEFGRTSHGTQKRSKYLWKYKAWIDAEFECVSFTQGEGKASIGIGALTLAVECVDRPDGVSQIQFNVGTGFTDDERRAMLFNPPIGKMIRVRYPYRSTDGIPQCPSFLTVMS